MRVIWNGICDPTLHVIAIALLLTGMGSVLTLDGSSGRESGPIKRCRFCVRYHYNANTRCVLPHLVVASQEPDRLTRPPRREPPQLEAQVSGLSRDGFR